MELLYNLLIVVFFMGGAFFFFVGTLGLIRMPDVFCRMHATTKCDTLGAGLILIGLMLYRGFDILSLKLLLIIMFIWITNPTAAHIIAKAEHNKGERDVKLDEE
ncbi:monovalent cation/H(+) antiporter subunit G [Alkaliphilus peptidifermentans]|uniref:Multisubunit sodium/proton antiporter, MrpG subunit n=1 Tax=Alkaliphilus peptidifermentans DSM 18978 TaxID=1120976 RepID=A0A1G5GDX9_9FIRM|nr:monovalent cation/H(+) antiporter subunit G [Alkaliphilus peptidifermentans]SCY49782.1 multisubunit sodium/proton antiporter, MrpG subunit [Alkaliphilus peptidifermentans DSM 18978]